jgi:hypothetical protein
MQSFNHNSIREPQPQNAHKGRGHKHPGPTTMPGAKNPQQSNKSTGHPANRGQQNQDPGQRPGQPKMAPQSNEDLMGSGKRQDDN